MVKAYEDYDYPAIFQIVNQFITVDLSAFYVDVTKDRTVHLRREVKGAPLGQTAMFRIVDGLARCWRRAVGDDGRAVEDVAGPARGVGAHGAFPADSINGRDAALLERWTALSAVRNQVNLQLEEKRKDKTIAANLSAHVVIEADGETAKLLNEYREFLPTLFGCV